MEAEEAYENGLLELANKELESRKKIKPDKEIIVAINEETQATDKPIMQSVSVDAACSGNPGLMQYRGVHTQTGKEFFYQEFKQGTNNIGEFLAIVHALAILKKRNVKLPLYTDSQASISWIKEKKCKTNLKRNSNTEKIYELIERAEKWLQENKYSTKILKWDTKEWGEIPADFGRK